MSFLTFSEVIDDDHETINNCAGKLKYATSLDEKKKWRDEVAWRLVRHDMSEEIVMRPAFEKYMGVEGVRILEEDRQDHQNAKEDLVKLAQIPLQSTEFQAFLEAMLATLADHMKHESGQHIPRLEKILSRKNSLVLAREYQRTQLVTPFVCRSDRPSARYFASVWEYLDAPLSKFLEVLETLPPTENAALDIQGSSAVHRRRSSKM